MMVSANGTTKDESGTSGLTPACGPPLSLRERGRGEGWLNCCESAVYGELDSGDVG